jgi:predicted dehydrogenase
VKDKAVFGLIGVGGISQNQHLPNLARASHVFLKTICDLDVELLDNMSTRYNVAQTTTRYQDILNDPDINAVVVATKGELHVPMTLEALAAGKHVYVEKPLAENATECKRVVDARQAAGKSVAVGFNRRRAPACLKAREIANGHGGPKQIQYRIADSYYEWKKKYNFPPGYRLVVEICHIFDLMRFLCDSPVRSVYCASSRDDDETILLQFESGCVASILSSGYVEVDMPKERMEMILEIGALTVQELCELRTYGLPDCQRRYCFEGHLHPERETLPKYLIAQMGAEAVEEARRVYYDNTRHLKQLSESGCDSQQRRELELYFTRNTLQSITYMVNKGWLDAIDHFAESIISNTPHELATPEDGLQAAAITQAAIESRSSGKVVYLDQ